MTYFKYSYLYWIPLLLITCLTLLSLCLVWSWEEQRTKKIVCLNRFVGTPLFVFWNVLSWILLVCFLAGLAVNADACSGYGSILVPTSPPSPLGTLLAAYYNLQPASGTTLGVSQLMLHYFGCVTSFPGHFEEYYLKYFTILVAGLELLNLVGSQPKLPPNWNSTVISQNSTLNSTLSSWIETAVLVNSTLTFNATSVCNSEGFEAFLGLAFAVQNSLINSGAYITAFITLLGCYNISPIYSTLANEAACTTNPAAMHWIFGSLLTASVCGLTAITVRSVMLPVAVLEDVGVSSHVESDSVDAFNEMAPEVLPCTHIVDTPVHVVGTIIHGQIEEQYYDDLQDEALVPP
eukprot:CAMPEP_0172433026 /NCGR_PEP_ID=MMETSP1064-20121228/66153_1 /TAXON_ID=202472 /ORGANISM="Aulacoseira subarctica , Strain CCAP 1002/5" /LENGTH=348 /DNA_ID=CAMNT_0013180715 /DNA_START=885 /DNA_END=1927 /DNA_ORIENTATION=-